MYGGAKKRGSKKAKASKKSKASKGSKKAKRELPPALVEFQKIIKFVSGKLGKGGRTAMKIASMLKKEVEKTSPNASPAEISKKACELYAANPNKYKAE
jgi:hypothetical protein